MKYRIPTYTVRLVRERAVIKCDTPDKAAEVLTELCTRDDQSRETMWCLHLDACSKIVGGECVAKGGGSSLSVSVADILRGAIVAGAQAIVLGHNHPSGTTQPSQADLLMTQAIKIGGEVVGVTLADHIVVTAYAGHYSMREMGDLD